VLENKNIESCDILINGRQAHYKKTGNGSPVIFVHGGVSDSRDWLETMEALSPYYSLYAPDIIGFGQSDRSKGEYYLSEFSDFLLDFCEELDLEPACLVGHSFGARICLEFALRHPERVNKLVLIDAVGLGKVSLFGMYVLTGFWLLHKLLKRQQPYPRFLADNGDKTHWLCDKRLPELTMPTLLVWKRLDIYLPVSIARRALHLIPEAKLVVVPGFGHAPHKQNNGLFNDILHDFLDQSQN
jgi:pimeloyl-ACP methyl ester carboxylesterase